MVLRDRRGQEIIEHRLPGLVHSSLLHTQHGYPVGLVVDTEESLDAAARESLLAEIAAIPTEEPGPASARVASVRSSSSSPWWVHASAVVPIGRWRVPSVCAKWKESATRTGPCRRVRAEAWAKGGELRGTSPARTAVLESVPAEGPANGLEPIPLDGDVPRAGVEGEYDLYDFGFDRYRRFLLEPDMSYTVDVIDTRGMTVERPAGTYSGRFRIALPGRQYIAVRLQRLS